MSTDITVSNAYGTGDYGSSGFGEPLSGELDVAASAGLLSTDGEIQIAVWGTAVDRITITSLWTGWTVQTHQDAGAIFTDAIAEDGAVHFEWAETATDVEPAVTLGLPDSYVGGEFEMTLSGTDGTDSEPAAVTVNLDQTV